MTLYQGPRYQSISTLMVCPRTTGTMATMVTMATMATMTVMKTTSLGRITGAAIASGMETQATRKPFGGVRNHKMMKIGTLGGITVRTTRMTAGIALTTSDKASHTSGNLEKKSGRDQTIAMKATMATMATMKATMAPQPPKRPWRT